MEKKAVKGKQCFYCGSYEAYYTKGLRRFDVQGKAFVQKVIKWLTAVKNVIAGKLKSENIIMCANVRLQEHCMRF